MQIFTPEALLKGVVIDSWARGIVTTKKVAVDMDQFRQGVPGAPTTPSVASSHISKGTYRSRTSAGSKSRLGTGRSRYDSDMDQTGKIIDLNDDFGDFSHLNLNATGQMFEQLQKMKRNKAQGYVSKETSEKGEFELIQDQLETAKREMRGKKFVLDRYGKPIPLSTIPTETLPPYVETPLVAVKDEPRNSQTSHSISSQITGHGVSDNDNKQSNMDKKRVLRVAGHRSVDGGTFEPSITLASSLAGIDNVSKLGKGVSVHSITGSKEGEALPEHPEKMSMKAYMKAQTLANAYSSNATTNTLGENSTTSFLRSAGNDDPLLSGSMMSDGVNLARSIQLAADIDPIEGSKEILVSEEKSWDLDDEQLGLGPITKSNAGSKQVGKFLERRNEQQRQEDLLTLTDSPLNGKVRERGLPKNQTPVKDRKHLPAPGIGEVTGHGLTKKSEYSLTEGNLSKDDWR